MKTREYTIRILEMIDDGIVDPRIVAEQALMWMSERDVKEMYIQGGGYVDFDELEDADDSMDGDTASALASAGFGTDEDYGSFSEEY